MVSGNMLHSKHQCAARPYILMAPIVLHWSVSIAQRHIYTTTPRTVYVDRWRGGPIWPQTGPSWQSWRCETEVWSWTKPQAPSPSGYLGFYVCRYSTFCRKVGRCVHRTDNPWFPQRQPNISSRTLRS